MSGDHEAIDLWRSLYSEWLVAGLPKECAITGYLLTGKREQDHSALIFLIDQIAGQEHTVRLPRWTAVHYYNPGEIIAF
jgi:hypothetical protein